MASERSRSSRASQSAIDDHLSQFNTRVAKYHEEKSINDDDSTWEATSCIDPGTTEWYQGQEDNPPTRSDPLPKRHSSPPQNTEPSQPKPIQSTSRRAKNDNKLRAALQADIKNGLRAYDALVSAPNRQEGAAKVDLRVPVLTKVPTFLISKPDGSKIIVNSSDPPPPVQKDSGRKASLEMVRPKLKTNHTQPKESTSKPSAKTDGPRQWTRAEAFVKKNATDENDNAKQKQGKGTNTAVSKAPKKIEDPPTKANRPSKNKTKAVPKAKPSAPVKIPPTAKAVQVSKTTVFVPLVSANLEQKKSQAQASLKSQSQSNPKSNSSVGAPIVNGPLIVNPATFVPPPASRNSFDLGQVAVAQWQLSLPQSVASAKSQVTTPPQASPPSIRKSSSIHPSSHSSKRTVTKTSIAPEEPWMSGALAANSRPASVVSKSTVKPASIHTEQQALGLTERYEPSTASSSAGKRTPSVIISQYRHVSPPSAIGKRASTIAIDELPPLPDSVSSRSKNSSARKPSSIGSGYFPPLPDSHSSHSSKRSTRKHNSIGSEGLPPLPESISSQYMTQARAHSSTYHLPTVESEHSSRASHQSRRTGRSGFTNSMVQRPPFSCANGNLWNEETHAAQVTTVGNGEADLQGQPAWADEAEIEAAQAWKDKVSRASSMIPKSDRVREKITGMSDTHSLSSRHSGNSRSTHATVGRVADFSVGQV